MKLVEFPVTNLNDIPAKLREMAKWIEDGTFEKTTAAVVSLRTEDGIKVHCFGMADAEGAYYMMGRAMRLLDEG